MPWDSINIGLLRRPTDQFLLTVEFRNFSIAGCSSLRHMTALMHIFESDDAVLTCRQDKATIDVH